MPKIFRTLFRPRESIDRSTYGDNVFTYNGVPYQFSAYGSSGYTKSEDLEHSFAAYVQQAYKANGPIFAVVLARLLLFSEGRFCWFEVKDDGELGNPAGIEGLDVLYKPWGNADTGELMARAEQDVSFGGAFIAAREPDRLRRCRPDWTTVVLTAPPAEATRSDVAGFWYHPGRTYSQVDQVGPNDEVYLPDEVCYWTPIPDPEAQYRGMSWLTPVLREVEADKSATAHKDNFFRNGATLGAIISAKENLTPTQFKDWQTNFSAAHVGVDNAYRPLFLASPVDVSVSGADMRQLDLKVIQGAGETRLCAAGGVPPIIVGLSEGLASATYSNYAMARRKFGDHWARPMWKSVANALSTVVEPPREGLRLGVNESGIAFLREDQKDAAEIQQVKANTINVYITAGFDPDSAVAAVEADDRTLLVHSGMTSVQLQPPGTEAPTEEPAEEIPEEDVGRARGDDDNLKEYWTKGPGLAKWVGSPHPWTALYNQLKKHMPDAMAKRVASEWFHDVTGLWSGERKGENPVGPG